LSSKNRLNEIQKLYLDTERQLIELSYTIPLDNISDVYSPRFYNILQFTCAQIHSLFKIISENWKLKPKGNTFPDYHKILNKKALLEKQEILQLRNYELLKPFNKIPHHDWWTGYNDTKHELPEGIRQGTLGNVLHALGAAFVLNNIANISTWNHEPNQVCDGVNWHNVVDAYTKKNLKVLLGMNTQSPVESTFFYLTTQYWAE